MIRRRTVLVWTALVSGTFGIPATATATIRVVPTDEPTIQAAIDASASGDTIHVKPGTYVESLSLAGKDVVIRGEYGISGYPDITTNDTARILDIGAGVTSATVIEELGFIDGRADAGGAIRLTGGASPRIRRCRFISNSAYLSGGFSRGGAIFVGSGSSLSIESYFFLNSALVLDDGVIGTGGAIYVDAGASLSVSSSWFERNSAQGLEGGPGAAVATASPATFDACTFLGNNGSDGAVYSYEADLAIRDCTFEGNGSGYGASALDWSGSSASLQLLRCAFFGNVAMGSTVRVYGAGDATNNTLVENDCYENGAMIDFGNGMNVSNNIVAQNRGYGLETDYLPGAVRCNDVWSNTLGDYGPTLGNQNGLNGNISADPLFCPNQYTDYIVRNLHLTAASPCAPGASACGLRGAFPVFCPPLAAASVGAALPAAAFLAPVAPNPTRSRLHFQIEVARAARLRLVVVDASGRARGVVADQSFQPGRVLREWSGADLEPGVYWALLQGEGVRQSRRFAIVR